MKLHLTLAAVLSMSACLATSAVAASPETASVMIPGIGSVEIPYPKAVSDTQDDDQLAIQKVTDEQLAQWLVAMGLDGVDEAETWIPVIDPHSEQWNSIDTRGLYYDEAGDTTLEDEVEQGIDKAAELASAIIAKMMELLDISFAEAADLLEQLLQNRDLGELKTMFDDVDDSWDALSLIAYILGESAEEQSRDLAYWQR